VSSAALLLFGGGQWSGTEGAPAPRGSVSINPVGGLLMVHCTLMVLRTRRYAAPLEDGGWQTLLGFVYHRRSSPQATDD